MAMEIELKALFAGFFGTIFLGLIVIPILRKLKIGQVVRSDGPQEHLKKAGTPTMGGIIMLIVILGVSFIISTKYPGIWPVTLVTIGYGIIGFIDDFIKLVLKNPKGLKPSLKMLGLIIVAVAFMLYLVYKDFGTETYIPFLKDYITLPEWFFIAGSVFVILACTNSLNLTDGLDGLAASVTTVIMIFFTCIAIIFGSKEMSGFSALVTGCALGFLLFNGYPAKVFMGDTGSLALGGAFCSVAIMLKMPLILVVVAGICVIEALSVILQVVYFKITNGKRLFKMAPIHHHLELSGMKETDIVCLFTIITVALAIISYFAIAP